MVESEVLASGASPGGDAAVFAAMIVPDRDNAGERTVTSGTSIKPQGEIDAQDCGGRYTVAVH
jgi:hypothetical protein